MYATKPDCLVLGYQMSSLFSESSLGNYDKLFILKDAVLFFCILFYFLYLYFCIHIIILYSVLLILKTNGLIFEFFPMLLNSAVLTIILWPLFLKCLYEYER